MFSIMCVICTLLSWDAFSGHSVYQKLCSLMFLHHCSLTCENVQTAIQTVLHHIFNTGICSFLVIHIVSTPFRVTIV